MILLLHRNDLILVKVFCPIAILLIYFYIRMKLFINNDTKIFEADYSPSAGVSFRKCCFYLVLSLIFWLDFKMYLISTEFIEFTQHMKIKATARNWINCCKSKWFEMVCNFYELCIFFKINLVYFGMIIFVVIITIINCKIIILLLYLIVRL